MTRRPVGGGGTFASLSDVDTTGLANGEVMVWSATAGKWIPGVVPAERLPSVNDPGAASAYNDEFDDGTGMSGPVNGLDPRWNLMSPTEVAFTQGAGVLATSSTTTHQGFWEAAPAGDFEVVARLRSIDQPGGRQMWGIYIANTDHTEGMCVGLDHPGGDASTRLRGMGADARGVVSTDTNSPWVTGTPIYTALKKVGDTYTGWAWTDETYDPGGVGGTSFTVSFVPARIGVARVYGGGGATIAVDWFRVR